MKEIKLVTIGAGSTFTPIFAELLVKFQNELPIREWVMEDIDVNRLDIVADFTKILLDQSSLPIPIRRTSSIPDAVRDADFVVTTMRVGCAQGRVLDETIPPKHGLVGQETTAPGGLAMGLRNIPVIVDVARAIEVQADPDCWLINLANPAGMLTEAVYRYSGCKAVGLCNWPIMAWETVAKAYHVPKDKVFLRFVGLNHLNWAQIYVEGHKVENDHRTLEKIVHGFSGDPNTSEIVGNMMQMMASADSADLVDFTGWPFMAPYNRFYYNMGEELGEGGSFHKTTMAPRKNIDVNLPPRLAKLMANAHSRAEIVAVQEEFVLDLYRNKDMKGYQYVKQTRGGGMGYADAGLDVVRAIWNNLNEIQIVDFPNWGAVDGLPREAVAQQPCLINRAGVWPIAMGRIPAHMTTFIQAAKQYEMLAIEAAMTGDYRLALEALVASPLLVSFVKARDALDELMVAHKAFLPNFARAIAKLEAGERPYAPDEK
jgi:6-phospho-beta-glucosidase